MLWWLLHICAGVLHLLLIQYLILRRRPHLLFDVMDKRIMRPAYAPSMKHTANTGRDILKKVRAVVCPSQMLACISRPPSRPAARQNLIDRVITRLVPPALGLLLSETLQVALLVDSPHNCVLTNELSLLASLARPSLLAFRSHVMMLSRGA